MSKSLFGLILNAYTRTHRVYTGAFLTCIHIVKIVSRIVFEHHKSEKLSYLDVCGQIKRLA